AIDGDRLAHHEHHARERIRELQAVPAVQSPHRPRRGADGHHGEPGPSRDLHHAPMRVPTRAARSVGYDHEVVSTVIGGEQSAQAAHATARGGSTYDAYPESSDGLRGDLRVAMPAEHDGRADRRAEAMRQDGEEDERFVPERVHGTVAREAGGNACARIDDLDADGAV